jgi:hypothetical protein
VVDADDFNAHLNALPRHEFRGKTFRLAGRSPLA